ncbi:hypothetical protein CP980_13185 [Streptomyces vinaceus]|uniref:Uncharacterized protein n=1 Tax=Streptomyces vinaceus TaxID=1960 RepID=A0A5J6J505_STRVI|nr:hypothetical protein [Streptomyces vinaceus]QEV45920.1 hypothetical protein CP980_13185 [Streptomyces vinaceus]GHE34363.1 hypothetical protein GCM10017778_16920 [Streptomyces vinaceus]
MARVTFVDEATSGDRAGGWEFEVAEERLALRELILVLVGDRQVTELDEVVDLPLGTEVTFLKLVALAGG